MRGNPYLAHCGESRENENTYRLAESRHQRNLSKIQAQALDPELSSYIQSLNIPNNVMTFVELLQGV